MRKVTEGANDGKAVKRWQSESWRDTDTASTEKGMMSTVLDKSSHAKEGLFS